MRISVMHSTRFETDTTLFCGEMREFCRELRVSVAPRDTAGASTKLFRAPEGRWKLAGGGARAQPPGPVEEDCSRPGRYAGPEFATGPIPVRRPSTTKGNRSDCSDGLPLRSDSRLALVARAEKFK